MWVVAILTAVVAVGSASSEVQALKVTISQSGARAITVNVGKANAKKRIIVELGSVRVNPKTGVSSSRFKKLGTFRTDTRGRATICKTLGLPKNPILRVRLGKKILVQRKFPKKVTSLTCGNTPNNEVSSGVSPPTDGVPAATVEQTLEAPRDLRLSEVSDTGHSSSDGITHATSLTFVGSTSPGNQVQLFVGGAPIGDPCLTLSSGVFECALSNVAEGGYQFSAKAIQGSLVSEMSSQVSITVDRTAPTVTMDSEKDLIGKNASTRVNIASNEEIAPMQLSDISLFCSMTGGCDIASLTGSGSNYSFTFSTINNEANGGAVVLEVGSISDLAGNSSVVRVVTSIGYDMFGPTYWMSVVDGQRLRLVFDEVPYNMTIDDFDIGLYGHDANGLYFTGFINRNNLSDLTSVSDDGTIWEMTLSPNIQGQISDSQNPWYKLHLTGSIEDEYGNLNGEAESGNTQSESDISNWPWPYA
ncbi:MAG: hypothetical protein RIR69_1486 [Actinomycetota bacterium]